MSTPAIPIRRVPRALVALLLCAGPLVAACSGGGDGIVTKSPTPQPLAVQANVVSFASTVGQPITPFTPLIVSGGSTPYTYAATGLPDGLTLDASSGTISGTPSLAQQASASLTVTDKLGAKSSAVSVSITINSKPALTIAGGNGGNPPQVSCLVGSTSCAIPVITLSSGTAPFTYSISPALPVGLSLNAQTGVISGAPAAPSTATVYSVTVTDKAGATATASFSLAAASLILTPGALEIGCGESNGCSPRIDSIKFVASSGTAPYVFTSTTLPTGVTLSSSTGQLSGTISAGLAPTPVTVTAADAQNRSAQSTITFSALYTSFVASSTISCTRAVACTTTVLNPNATGKQPYGYTVVGALPGGFAVNATTGAITGSGATSGTTALTMRVTDALGRTSEKPFTLVVQEPALATTVAVAEFACGESNGCTPTAPFTPVTASGGIVPYTYSVAPALPTGMSLNAGTGVVTGTPSASLTQTNFTMTVQDNASPTKASSSKAFAISALYTTVAASTNCPLAQPCTLTPVLANLSGKAPYTYAIVSGTLPTGLAFNTSTGAISGTSATSSSTPLTIRVTDALARTSDKAVTLTVLNPVLTLTQAIATVAYGRESGWKGASSPFTPITASGGTVPYVFATSGLSLPAGMTLSASTGAISGAPNVGVAPTAFTIRVTDAATPAATDTKAFSLSALYATTNVATLTCTVGQSCAATPVSASTAARTPLSYQVAAGTLPAGLTLDPVTGALGGTPTAASTQVVRLRITDALAASDTASVTITVVPPFSATTVIDTVACGETNGCWNSVVGEFTGPFKPVVVSGGVAPIRYSSSPDISSGTGLVLDSTTGVISGAGPGMVGAGLEITHTIIATDALGRTAQSTFLKTGPFTGIAPTQFGIFPSCNQSRPCNFTPVRLDNRGTAPYTWSALGLPPSLTVNTSTGTLQGTPTTVGSYNPSVFVIDKLGRTSGKSFTLQVNSTPASFMSLTVAVPEFDCGENGCTPTSPFTPILVSGGSGSYSFQAFDMPGSMNSLTGEVTASQPNGFTRTIPVWVTDNSTGFRIQSDFRTSTLSTYLSTPNPTTACQTTVPCSFRPVSHNGTGRRPYTYSVSGALPAGLSMNTSTGTVSGTPAAAGSTTVVITVTDSFGRTSAKSVTFLIR